MTAAAGAGSPMTMPAHDLGVFIDGLGRLGHDVDALLAAAGLSREDLTDPDATVPCEACGAVFGRAQQARYTPNLALELARVTPLGAWPLIDYLVLTTDSVGAGVHQLARYFRLVSDPVRLTVVSDTTDPVRVGMAASTPSAIEFEAALMIFRFRDETDGPFDAAVSFQHTPDDPVAFERLLGCPVAARATWSGLTVPLAVWRMPLRRRDPVLRRVLEDHANALMARLPAATGVAADVQHALTSRVAGGDTRIDVIARELAMSARTLQRKLADEGTSYQKLVDTVRKEAARRYMSESTLAIGEIAYLLGYSEPAPFHRAFRRWYGTTPDVFRSGARS